MFKKIGAVLHRRQRTIEKLETLQHQTSDAVTLFLRETFGETGSVISYRWKEDVLWIQTANKVLASELTMRLPEFVQFLRVRSIPVSRIVVQ